MRPSKEWIDIKCSVSMQLTQNGSDESASAYSGVEFYNWSSMFCRRTHTYDQQQKQQTAEKFRKVMLLY